MKPLPPALTAMLDQRNAATAEAFNQMVGTVTEMLDDGIPPEVAAAGIAGMFRLLDPGRACTLAGYALVRYAQEARP